MQCKAQGQGARGATRAAGMESLQSIQALLLEIFPRACGRKKERKPVLENTKTTTKHTPGPWEIRTDREFYRNTTQPFCIASTGMDDDSPLECSRQRWVCRLFDSWDEQAKADAALIASAPELLEALQFATALLKHAWDDPALLHSQFADETAAIMADALAKATGEEVAK